MTRLCFSSRKSWEDTQQAIAADHQAEVIKRQNRRLFRDENKKVCSLAIRLQLSCSVLLLVIILPMYHKYNFSCGLSTEQQLEVNSRFSF